ncbi:MAG: KH domain-containing protein [Chitinophagales bacterium]
MENGDIIKISADIYVEQESQKPILIGKGGEMLKSRYEARKDLEKFFGKKIFLETHVRVSENWRNNDSMLRKFGYRDY